MIPFLDLKAQYRTIGEEIEASVTNVLRNGEYILGSSVASFEKNFASYCGTKEAVALNSGTSALHLALLSLGVGSNDEVITVPMTFVATVAAIRYTGATPVFVDIDPKNWTMDPGKLERAITSRTKVILPVHLHGRLADMESISAIADAHGIPVVEDAAQAHGAEINGQRAGSFGMIGCFSFYPGKNLGACGEGGAIVTGDIELATKVRMLRDWGQTKKYNHDFHGFNYRMDAIQGAVLDIKLRYLNDWTTKRIRAAKHYDEILADTEVDIPAPSSGFEHVYHVYSVRSRKRDTLQQALATQGVATNIHYPRPVHLQRAYAGLGSSPGDFPAAEQFASEALSLPMYPELTVGQIERVCEAVRSSIARGK
jgi:dTDP-4-amino-4,6-dideoxygalactose transaminase